MDEQLSTTQSVGPTLEGLAKIMEAETKKLQQLYQAKAFTYAEFGQLTKKGKVKVAKGKETRTFLTCNGFKFLAGITEDVCCPRCHEYDNRNEIRFVQGMGVSHVMAQSYLSYAGGPEQIGRFCCSVETLNNIVVNCGSFEKYRLKFQGKNVFSMKSMAERMQEDPYCPGRQYSQIYEPDGNVDKYARKPLYPNQLLPFPGRSWYVYLNSILVKNESWYFAYCRSPFCLSCATDNDKYWSFKMQAWVDKDYYSIQDNFFHLSAVRSSTPSAKAKHCSPHSVEWEQFKTKSNPFGDMDDFPQAAGKKYIYQPEYELHLITSVNPYSDSKEPESIYGWQYTLDPHEFAVVKLYQAAAEEITADNPDEMDYEIHITSATKTEDEIKKVVKPSLQHTILPMSVVEEKSKNK